MQITCENCGKSYDVDVNIIGRRVKCKQCGAEFTAQTPPQSNSKPLLPRPIPQPEKSTETPKSPSSLLASKLEGIAKKNLEPKSKKNNIKPLAALGVSALVLFLTVAIGILLFGSNVKDTKLIKETGVVAQQSPLSDESLKKSKAQFEKLSAKELVSRYMESTNWEEKLSFVDDQELCKPLMEIVYKDGIEKIKFIGFEGGDSDPSVGMMRHYVPVIQRADGVIENGTPVPVLNTRETGMKIDWLHYRCEDLLKRGVYTGRIGKEVSIPTITSTLLEVVPERYVGKEVRLLCANFYDFDTLRVAHLPGVMIRSDRDNVVYKKGEYEKWTGCTFKDFEGNFIYGLFFLKEKHLDSLLELSSNKNKNEIALNIRGHVVELEGGYGEGIVVFDMERTFDYRLNYK